MFNWKYLFNILTFDARAAFRFRAAAASVFVSCGCVCVWVWERAKVSVRYFSGRSMSAPSRRLVSSRFFSLSLSLSPLPLFNRFACSTDLILELHLMTLNLQRPKGRKRERESEQCKQWFLDACVVLSLPPSHSLLLLSPVLVCVCFRLYDFEYFPIFWALFGPVYFSASLFICFVSFCFFLLIFFTAIYNF